MTTEMQRHHEIVRVGDKVEACRDGVALDADGYGFVGFVAKIESRPFGQDYLVRRDPAEQGFWFTRDELTRV